MSSTWLPLEEALKRVVESSPNLFPAGTDNYWSRYTALVNYLRNAVYNQINGGLACLSKSPGIYTDHGPDHFDEVVRYAGLLVGDLKQDDVPNWPLAPYDLFLLLCAIRLHDAGNGLGREGHETRAYQILQDAGNSVCSDNFEARLIAEIAEAHGGEFQGNKDKIGQLQETSGFGATVCRPQSIAALVRFSDEICEHSNRASKQHLTTDTLPAGNKLFHLYAYSVKQAIPIRSEKVFKMQLDFDAEYLDQPYPTPKHTNEAEDLRYLLDEAVERITKLDTERRYCNRFLDPRLQTTGLQIRLAITRTTTSAGYPSPKTWKEWTFKIVESGYPTATKHWLDKCVGLAGMEISKQLQETPA